uniref:Uncharacterized protein n=1 Tax=Trichogramma kaykai TaxID=54128 RepID=A0ABD2WN42_9HYME
MSLPKSEILKIKTDEINNLLESFLEGFKLELSEISTKYEQKGKIDKEELHASIKDQKSTTEFWQDKIILHISNLCCGSISAGTSLATSIRHHLFLSRAHFPPTSHGGARPGESRTSPSDYGLILLKSVRACARRKKEQEREKESKSSAMCGCRDTLESSRRHDNPVQACINAARRNSRRAAPAAAYTPYAAESYTRVYANDVI